MIYMNANVSFSDNSGATNPLQGTENNQPLPNPWAPASTQSSSSSSSSPATTTSSTAPTSAASMQGNQIPSVVCQTQYVQNIINISTTMWALFHAYWYHCTWDLYTCLCLWDISYPANLNQLILMFVKIVDIDPLSKRWSNFGNFQTLILSNNYFTS